MNIVYKKKLRIGAYIEELNVLKEPVNKSCLNKYYLCGAIDNDGIEYFVYKIGSKYIGKIAHQPSIAYLSRLYDAARIFCEHNECIFLPFMDYECCKVCKAHNLCQEYYNLFEVYIHCVT